MHVLILQCVSHSHPWHQRVWYLYHKVLLSIVLSHEERRMFPLCTNEIQGDGDCQVQYIPWNLAASLHYLSLHPFYNSAYLSVCLKTNDPKRLKPKFCKEHFSIQSALRPMNLRLGTLTSLEVSLEPDNSAPVGALRPC